MIIRDKYRTITAKNKRKICRLWVGERKGGQLSPIIRYGQMN
nr:MAG TPA: hypothetical protein [Caudoviricetes sp.]